jgi:hypothetical protein
MAQKATTRKKVAHPKPETEGKRIRRERQANLLENVNKLLDSGLINHFSIDVSQHQDDYFHNIAIPLGRGTQFVHSRLSDLIKLAEENDWTVNIDDRISVPGPAITIYFGRK